MASGRNAPHTAAAERPSAEPSFAEAGRADPSQRTVADTERLGIDVDVAEQPAHAWEVGEAASWEPSVTDTWNPPGGSPRVEPEVVEAAGGAAALPAERTTPPTVPPTERAARSARQALNEALRSSAPETAMPAPEMDPARMAVSLASLAAERMRAAVPAGDGLVTGLGLARQTANGLLALGQRLLEPASRLAAGAVRGAARLPVAGRPVRVALRSGQWLARSGAEAREKLRASLEGARGPNRETGDTHEVGPASSSTDDSPLRMSPRTEGAAASRP